MQYAAQNLIPLAVELGGKSPNIFFGGEFLVGDGDVLLGEIDGNPFYIDARLDDAWGHRRFVVDVEPGPPEGFSLAAGKGLHFVTRSPACSLPDGCEQT